MARRRAGEGEAPAGGDEAGRLLATPPARFTSERDALARALAERGDAAGAAAIRKLRRPVGLAWVLNRLARERREEVEALLAAGDRLRTGQRRALAGQGAEELREAELALRKAARALRGRAGEVLSEEGRPASPGALARVELLLRVAAAAPGDARASLREGAFSREPEVAGGDLSGLGVVAERLEPARRARGAGAGGKAGEGERRGGEGGGGARRRPAAEDRRAEREAAAARAREARAQRQRAQELTAARRRLAQAQRAARAARSAAEAAARRADVARARAEAAEATEAARRDEVAALERGE
ncbi:hypothetical protein [Anaeromyxobacter sp. Fw109-5]|uniref:hypothetical protein n=1 Tax=Anaeromyxobacter sp. (strain Fw109-5) TaxID=404589 RepID=UPI0000ED6CF7|nr:hypothetical protein [Anaeromyxobacter sp. Fw109-5]ABS28459.1 conserved hypothetical protein [Anaeromyxobacter sp. Fw109-5]